MTDQNSKQKQPNVVERLRVLRDAGLQSCARVVLAVTTSPAYARTSSLVAKPALVLAAIARRRTELAMAQLLSQMSLPSRNDVLGLSKRLTHIEMTLDDLGATLEALRADAARAAGPAPAGRARAKAPIALSGREGK